MTNDFYLEIKNLLEINQPILIFINKHNLLFAHQIDRFLLNAVCNENPACKKCPLCLNFLNDNLENIQTFNALKENTTSSSLKVDDVRNYIKEINKYQTSQQKLVLMIKNIDYANQFIQNTLLKYFESYLKNNAIFLLASNNCGINSTILSRCIIIYFEKHYLSFLKDFCKHIRCKELDYYYLHRIAITESAFLKYLNSEDYTLAKKIVNKIIVKKSEVLTETFFSKAFNNNLYRDYDLLKMVLSIYLHIFNYDKEINQDKYFISRACIAQKILDMPANYIPMNAFVIFLNAINPYIFEY